MSAPAPEPPLAWQKNSVFRFFASLRLAMVLLGVLIIASVIGTLYESTFDAKVARAYIYGAPWFTVWLLLLGLNLLASALSRMPWQRHHTGFLLTHLGIILILIGSFIGHWWGIEGSMVLFKGEPPTNRLTLDERILQIAENDQSAKLLPFEFINHHPTPAHPRHLATTDAGWDLQAIDYSSALEVKTEAQPLPAGGSPAVHVILSTAMMNQKLDTWLLAQEGHSAFDLGLASITLKEGAAPNVNAAPDKAMDIEESIFAFANAPADQVAKVIKGGGSGAQIKLLDTANANTARILVQMPGLEQSFPINAPNTPMPIANSPYTISIDQYWPDFRIENGRPLSLSDQPNNPCVLVTLRGHAIPVHVSLPESGKNNVVLYIDNQNSLSYELSSRKSGLSDGKLAIGKPLPTGWADWQLVVDQALPHASPAFTAQPAQQGRTEGVLVRATRADQVVEKWIPLGWQIPFSTSPRPMLVGYGLRQYSLPVSLQLLDFVVDRDEGSDSPAGFKSTLQITNMEGRTATDQCWMNHPISFPANWFNTFTGLTYKISQASWNPENLAQSSVQILRDPGWSLKWMGSLLVVAGIFSLFYLRPDPEKPMLATKQRTPLPQSSANSPQPVEATL